MGKSSFAWRGRFWWPLSLAATTLLIGCCAGLAHFAIRPTNGARVENLEREIKELLPVGSSREQVISWLAFHQFESWDIEERSGRKCGTGTTIPNSSWVQSALIDIEFYFDDRGGLEKIYIERECY